jgi:hypothetical protein
MPIEIKNAEVLIKLPEERLKAIDQNFEQALSDEATQIVLRTRRGVDADGSPFAPYTEAYAKRRSDKGRRTSPVDLTFTGNMLNAITVKVVRTLETIVGTIFFNSTTEALKARGNQEKRRFFGLSEEQVKRLTDKLRGSK